MRLDHATVVTSDLDTVKHFFCDIVGLSDGKRPPFTFEGHWLYHDGKPIIHLIKSRTQHPPAKNSSRIDHIAFRVVHESEWDKLITKLQAANITYQSSEVPTSGERQLFVTPTQGVMIEFVTSAA